jgi:hypothetical protein
MWKWRNGPRPKALLLCAFCALLGIVGGTDPAPAATRAEPAAGVRVLSGHAEPQGEARARRAAAAPRTGVPPS